jgi:hypothetical protein
MRLIFCFLLMLFSSRDSRIVYDTPSPTYAGNSPETVMTQAPKEATYRFSAYIETQPGAGCEYDTTVDLVRSYVRITPNPKSPQGQGLSGWQRYRVTIRKDSSIVEGAEIPAAVFRVRAGSRISYHVEMMIGGRCKTRPTYQVFPVLEKMDRAKKEKP